METVILDQGVQFADLTGGLWIAVRAKQYEIPRVLAWVAAGDRTAEFWVGLGDEFPVGDQTWRFEDIEFFGSTERWNITFRRVHAGTPPYQPPAVDRAWHSMELRSFGPLDEAAIAAFEERAGLKLPSLYRQWLGEHNGAYPGQDASPLSAHMVINEVHPILGIHPDVPHRDLSFGERLRKPWLTDNFLVIAVPIGGLLAVRLTYSGGNADDIVYLPDDARVPMSNSPVPPPPQPLANRPRRIASSIWSFCANLQPLRPVTLGRIGTF